MDHPVINEEDVIFLKQEENVFYTLTSETNKELNEMTDLYSDNPNEK